MMMKTILMVKITLRMMMMMMMTMTLTCLPLRAFEPPKVRERTGTPVKARLQGSPSWSSS